MSLLMIFLATWLGSALLVLIGGLWLAFRYPLERERSKAEGLTSESAKDVKTSSSQPASAPQAEAGSPEMSEMQSRELDVESRR